MKTKLGLTILFLFVVYFSFGQVIEKHKMSLGGYKYSQKGVQTKVKTVVYILKRDASDEIYKKAITAKSNLDLVKAFSFIGGGLIGWEIGEKLSAKPINWTVMGAGIGIIAISIPISKKSYKKMNNAIDMYNETLGVQSFNQENEKKLELKSTGNSFGLVMTF